MFKKRTFSKSKTLVSSQEFEKEHFFFKKTQKLIILCFLMNETLSWLPKIWFLKILETRFAMDRSHRNSEILLKNEYFAMNAGGEIINNVFLTKKCCHAICEQEKMKKLHFCNIFFQNQWNPFVIDAIVARKTTNSLVSNTFKKHHLPANPPCFYPWNQIAWKITFSNFDVLSSFYQTFVSIMKGDSINTSLKNFV